MRQAFLITVYLQIDYKHTGVLPSKFMQTSESSSPFKDYLIQKKIPFIKINSSNFIIIYLSLYCLDASAMTEDPKAGDALKTQKKLKFPSMQMM